MWPLTRNAIRRATVTRRLLRSCKGWANTTRYLQQWEKLINLLHRVALFLPFSFLSTKIFRIGKSSQSLLLVASREATRLSCSEQLKHGSGRHKLPVEKPLTRRAKWTFVYPLPTPEGYDRDKDRRRELAKKRESPLRERKLSVATFYQSGVKGDRATRAHPLPHFIPSE